MSEPKYNSEAKSLEKWKFRRRIILFTETVTSCTWKGKSSQRQEINGVDLFLSTTFCGGWFQTRNGNGMTEVTDGTIDIYSMCTRKDKSLANVSMSSPGRRREKHWRTSCELKTWGKWPVCHLAVYGQDVFVSGRGEYTLCLRYERNMCAHQEQPIF